MQRLQGPNPEGDSLEASRKSPLVDLIAPFTVQPSTKESSNQPSSFATSRKNFHFKTFCKKLSIPDTVSRVLKYIPELQKEVEKLVKKKEELLSRISRQADLGVPERQRKVAFRSTLSAVSASRLGDGEVVSQISTVNDNNNLPLSEVLLNLEEDGLLLLNSSSFPSSGGKIFHNLHLQVQGSQKMEPEMLREKLLSLYEKREELFP